MKDPETLALCPKLVPMLEEAFAQEMAAFEHNIEHMRSYHAARDAGHHAELSYPDGTEAEIYDPVYMERNRDYIQQCWRELQDALGAATNAGQQAALLLNLQQNMFAESSLSGNCLLAPRFFASLATNIADRYQQLEQDVINDPEATPLSDQEIFLAEVLPQMSSYCNLSLEALDDIVSLTHAAQMRRGITIADDDTSITPYHVTKQRYCQARGIPYNDFVQIPESDKDDFLIKEQRFYRNEIFGPFREYIPDSCLCPEMAWFVVAAANVVRMEQAEEELAQREEAWRPRFKLATGQHAVSRYPNPVVDKILRRGPMRGPMPEPAQDSGVPLEQTLCDPAVYPRIGALLAEICEDYPDMASSPASLVEARAQFISTYLTMEEPQIDSARGPQR